LSYSDDLPIARQVDLSARSVPNSPSEPLARGRDTLTVPDPSKINDLPRMEFLDETAGIGGFPWTASIEGATN
jgi:hypothetical protein